MVLKYTIVLILILRHTLTTAQTSTYHPFPDSSAVWTEQATSCCASFCPGLPFPDPVYIDYTFSYFLSGDTLINGFTYSKIYKSGFAHEHCLLGTSVNNWVYYNNDYVGGLRQDVVSRLVFYMDTGGNECLLYDFNLGVGDTVNSSCSIWGTDCAVVIAMDSLYAAGNYRKVFHLSTIPPYSIIEGIGSTSGLMEPLCPIDYSSTLVCFTQDGTTLYPDALTPCEIVSAVKELPVKPHVRVWPNPVKETVTVQLDAAWGKINWNIYNSIGQIVKNGTAQSPVFEITRGSLPPGIYLLHAATPQGEHVTQLMVME